MLALKIARAGPAAMNVLLPEPRNHRLWAACWPKLAPRPLWIDGARLAVPQRPHIKLLGELIFSSTPMSRSTPHSEVLKVDLGAWQHQAEGSKNGSQSWIRFLSSGIPFKKVSQSFWINFGSRELLDQIQDLPGLVLEFVGQVRKLPDLVSFRTNSRSSWISSRRCRTCWRRNAKILQRDRLSDYPDAVR